MDLKFGKSSCNTVLISCLPDSSEYKQSIAPKSDGQNLLLKDCKKYKALHSKQVGGGVYTMKLEQRFSMLW